MIKVSVLINNYNYAQFVAQAIESAIAQSFPSMEIVVVDDGSKDESRTVIETYRDRVGIVLQENGGQAAAINAAVKASRGEILCFLDADDYWAPEKVARIYQAFEADREVVLAYHRLQPVKDGQTDGLKPIPRTLCPGDLSNRMLRSAGWWPFPMTSAIAVRRSTWDEVGEIPQSFRISADAWLVGLYPFIGHVAALPATLGYYRLHGSNNWTRQLDATQARRRLAHWSATVDATNRFLAERGIPDRLDLDDHWPYQILKAELDGIPPVARARLALRGLAFGGEPNLIQRTKDAARVFLGPRTEQALPAMEKRS